jgi:hypothetical protein
MTSGVTGDLAPYLADSLSRNRPRGLVASSPFASSDESDGSSGVVEGGRDKRNRASTPCTLFKQGIAL